MQAGEEGMRWRTYQPIYLCAGRLLVVEWRLLDDECLHPQRSTHPRLTATPLPLRLRRSQGLPVQASLAPRSRFPPPNRQGLGAEGLRRKCSLACGALVAEAESLRRLLMCCASWCETLLIDLLA